MNTIIEKIKTWVNQRKKALHSTLFNDEYNDFLSFLSDLEKSEVPKEIEEAAKMTYPNEEGDLYSLHSTLQRAAFKAGASWQKERDEKELSEKIASAYQLGRKDEKEQMMKEANKALESCDKNTASYKDAFFAGVDWKEREMMKEAVEGEVVKDITNKLAVTAKVNLDGFKFGDKVKLIIIKEEWK